MQKIIDGYLVDCEEGETFDRDTQCSCCHADLSRRAFYTCEETGLRQCSWSCRITWLQVLAGSKEKN